MRKIFTFFLALAASAGTIFADGTKIGDLYYNLDNEEMAAVVTYQELSENNYSGFSKVVIPSSVSYGDSNYDVISIGSNAFINCSGLTYIIVCDQEGLMVTCEPHAFEGVDKSIPVYVPHGGLEEYKDAEGWNEFTNIKGYKAYGNCGAEGDNLTWILDYEGVLTISGTGLMANYSYSKDYAPWLKCCNNGIRSIVIEEGVTSIGNFAFLQSLISSNQSLIFSVSIPSSVTSIGDGAFAYCNSLTSVTIPQAVTSIGDYAFYKCSGLTAFTIPNGVTSIGDYAFSDCTNLPPIICEALFPPALGDKVFEGIDKSYPLSVPGIAIDLYKEVDQWKDFTMIFPIPGTEVHCEQYLIEEDPFKIMGNFYWEGIEFEWRGRVINHAGIYYDSLKTIVGGCDSVYMLEVAKGRREIIIDCQACDSVVDVWESNPILIYYCTFYGEPFELASYYTEESGYGRDFPHSVSFSGSSADISQKNPKVIEVIGVGETLVTFHKEENDDFHGGDYQILIRVTEPTHAPCIIASGYCGAEGDSTSLRWELSCDSVLTIVGNGAMKNFDGDGGGLMSTSPKRDSNFLLKSPLDPPILPSTGDGQPWELYLSMIRDIYLGDGITSIGNNAFDGCTNVHMVELPNTLKIIGNGAFSACDHLPSLIIPEGVTSIGERTFQVCEGLDTIVFRSSVPPTVGEDCFYQCMCVFSVPCGSKEAYATGLSVNLDRVVEPEGCGPVPCIVASGYCGAEGDSTNLHWELSCDGILTISGTGEMADFRINPTIEHPWYQYNSLIKSIVMQEGITYIGKFAFYQYSNSSITSVIIPNSVTKIGWNAFSGCSALTTIIIPENVTDIGGSAFWGCANLESITIPNSVRLMWGHAFQGCSKLTSVHIPSNVVYIGEGTFGNCNNLRYFTIDPANPEYRVEDGVLFDKDKTILVAYPVGRQGAYTIPDGITTIRGMAFQGCYTLTSIKIPSSVTSIQTSSFANCLGLAEIYNFAPIPQKIESATFANVVKSVPLYVPCASMEAFKTADIWSNFINIQPMDTLTFIADLLANDDNFGKILIREQQYISCDTLLVTVEAMPVEGYLFKQWSDGNTDNPRTLELTTDTLLMAAFEKIPSVYMVSLDVNDALMGSIEGAGKYTEGTLASVVAVPSETYRFVGWYTGEDLVSNEPNMAIIVEGDTTLQAKFEPIPMFAELAMIYIDGKQIENFAADNYNYTFRYPAGTAESALPSINDITVDKGDEYQEVTKSSKDNTIMLTVTSGRGLTKVYVLTFIIEVPDQFMVTALSGNDVWGQVMGGGLYNENSSVSITAIPNEGYQFYNWNNSITENPHSFMLTQDTSFIALFLPDKADEVVTAVGTNSILFEWEHKPFAWGYWLYVYLDSSHTVWLCRVKFVGLFPFVLPVDFDWGPGYGPSYIAKVRPEKENVQMSKRTYKSGAIETISYTLENLASGTEHFFVIEAFDEAEYVVEVEAGSCTTKSPQIPTINGEITTGNLDVLRKVLIGGQLFILRDGKTYNAQGARVE